MQRVVVRLAVGLAALIAFAGFAGQAMAAGNVVISQVYGGGGNSGATLKNDYIELYNRGARSTSRSPAGRCSTRPAGQHVAADGALRDDPGRRLLPRAGGRRHRWHGRPPTPDATGTSPWRARPARSSLIPTNTTITSGTLCPTDAVDIVGYGTAATTCYETAPTADRSPTRRRRSARANFAQDTDDNSADFTVGAPAPKGDSTGGGGGDTGTPLKIHQIQGAAQMSPVAGTPSRRPASSPPAHGRLLHAGPEPGRRPGDLRGRSSSSRLDAAVTVGDSVAVTGRCRSSAPGGATSGNLTTTELGSPIVTVAMPTATRCRRRPSSASAAGSAARDRGRLDAGNVETSDTFDPDQDGLDFWESLEGMRVAGERRRRRSARTNSFGETAGRRRTTARAGLRTPRGGILARPDDFNPERIILDDRILADAAGRRTCGDHFDGPIVGVLDYNFGNFMLEVDAAADRASTAASRAR